VPRRPRATEYHANESPQHTQSQHDTLHPHTYEFTSTHCAFIAQNSVREPLRDTSVLGKVNRASACQSSPCPSSPVSINQLSSRFICLGEDRVMSVSRLTCRASVPHGAFSPVASPKAHRRHRSATCESEHSEQSASFDVGRAPMKVDATSVLISAHAPVDTTMSDDKQLSWRATTHAAQV
jgi:hypothetical protein